MRLEGKGREGGREGRKRAKSREEVSLSCTMQEKKRGGFFWLVLVWVGARFA